MLTSNESLLAKKEYLMGATLKELQILKCNQTIAEKEKSQKDGKVKIQVLSQKRPAHQECNVSFRELACMQSLSRINHLHLAALLTGWGHDGR